MTDRSPDGAGGDQEEAENERMHLLTGLKLKSPSIFFKSAVWITQGIFFNFFFASYLISPRYNPILSVNCGRSTLYSPSHMPHATSGSATASWATWRRRL